MRQRRLHRPPCTLMMATVTTLSPPTINETLREMPSDPTPATAARDLNWAALTPFLLHATLLQYITSGHTHHHILPRHRTRPAAVLVRSDLLGLCAAADLPGGAARPLHRQGQRRPGDLDRLGGDLGVESRLLALVRRRRSHSGPHGADRRRAPLPDGRPSDLFRAMRRRFRPRKPFSAITWWRWRWGRRVVR